MPSPREFPGPGRRHVVPVGLAFAVLASLGAGCSGPPLVAAAPHAAAHPAAAHPVAARPVAAASQAPAETQALAVVASAATAERRIEPDRVAAVLVYADRLSGAEMTERVREIARLGDPSAADDQMRLAIVLSQTRQAGDLINAQQQLQRVLASPGKQALALQPLARLLFARLFEQRRAEDLLERQSQQLRDLQIRLEQTRGKLDALKEIERSLNKRPSGP